MRTVTKQKKLQDHVSFTCISHEEKLENLLLLLSDDDRYATKSMVSLPTNEDVLRELNKGQRHTQAFPKKHKSTMLMKYASSYGKTPMLNINDT